MAGIDLVNEVNRGQGAHWQPLRGWAPPCHVSWPAAKRRRALKHGGGARVSPENGHRARFEPWFGAFESQGTRPSSGSGLVAGIGRKPRQRRARAAACSGARWNRRYAARGEVLDASLDSHELQELNAELGRARRRLWPRR